MPSACAPSHPGSLQAFGKFQRIDHFNCAFDIYSQYIHHATPSALMDPEEKLLSDLRAWARAEYGRPAFLARKLGVSPGLLSHWITGRRTPSLHHGLAIQAFLKSQAKHRKKKNS